MSKVLEKIKGDLARVPNYELNELLTIVQAEINRRKPQSVIESQNAEREELKGSMQHLALDVDQFLGSSVDKESAIAAITQVFDQDVKVRGSAVLRRQRDYVIRMVFDEHERIEKLNKDFLEFADIFGALPPDREPLKEDPHREQVTWITYCVVYDVDGTNSHWARYKDTIPYPAPFEKAVDETLPHLLFALEGLPTTDQLEQTDFPLDHEDKIRAVHHLWMYHKISQDAFAKQKAIVFEDLYPKMSAKFREKGQAFADTADERRVLNNKFNMFITRKIEQIEKIRAKSNIKTYNFKRE